MEALSTHQLLNLIFFQLVTHFVADFVFQTRQMGEEKGKSLKWLTIHVITYTVVFAIVSSWYLLPLLGWKHFIGYIILNGLFHFVTDFLTSKLTGYFYLKSEDVKFLEIDDEEKKKLKRKYMKGFWTTIGFDQLIHGTTIVETLQIFI